MKTFTYICALLLGVLFISASLPSRDTQTTANVTITDQNDNTTISPNLDKPANKDQREEYGESLQIEDVTISLGENVDSVINKLGMANRIVDTEYTFEYYVYNNNYRRLLFIAIKEDKVVGFYTDSEDFLFKGVYSGANLSSVNDVLGKDYSMNEVLTYPTKEYTAKILMDTVVSETVTGIYVLDNSLDLEEEYTLSVTRNIELLNYDLVNSIRARHGLSLLSWSSTAAKAARKHSLDMADNNYFDHISPYGRTPGDRLREEGQNYSHIAENIIAGYGTAILSNHAWYNSPDHRNNLLNPDYTCIGVGFVYLQESHYKTYITQEFYR